MSTRGIICGILLFLSVAVSANQVQFAVTYTDADGAGFYDPTYGTARQTAFQYACNIWSGYLGLSYAGETIRVSASFTGMGGTETSATLGSAGPANIYGVTFPGIGDLGVNAANANHLLKYNIYDDVEIVAQFNSDVDNSTVLGSAGFYYGLDGNCGNDIDFVSVLLHEIGHGLGFTSLIANNGTLFAGIPSLYDYFLATYTGSDFAFLTNMTDEERLAAITSDNLYWLGDHAVAANDGNAVKIYAPEIWESGSSITHVDEASYPNTLMSPYYSGVIHTPDNITLGMLGDLGWSIIPEPSPMIMIAMVCLAALWIRRRFYD